jgi:hypothetical protein
MWRLKEHEAASTRHLVAPRRDSRAWIFGVDAYAASKMNICKSTDEKVVRGEFTIDKARQSVRVQTQKKKPTTSGKLVLALFGSEWL